MKGTRLGISVALGALSLGIAGTAGAEEPAELAPRGSYVRVDLDPSRVITSDDEPVFGGGPPHILFLNRCTGGETITPGGGGSVANQSSILSFSVNFPPFPYGDAAWSQVMDHARSIFSPFNISVVDVDPGNTPHDEAIVCGDAAQAGFNGAGGVAPFTCGIINNPITFTFAETLGNNPRLLAEVVAQEAAHAWGLDHEYLCQDPMTYLSGCGNKTFQDVDAQCGEFSARSCDCGGGTQNSYQHILNAFGSAVPDTQAPTAAITYPHDGDVFEPGSDFEITVDVNDDVQVTLVTLYSNDAPAGADETSPFGPWPVTNIPEGVYSFYIEAEDPAGNLTQSPTVTINVSATGEPPPPDSGGDSDPGGSTGGDGGIDSDGVDTNDGVTSGPGGDDAGALPDGYSTGLGPEPTANGCDCTTGDSPRGAMGFGLMLLALLGLRRGRRRS